MCIQMEFDITTSDTILTTRKLVAYFGIQLDPRLTFAKVTSLYSRLLASISGPIQSRLRLMLAITNYILLYGSDL